MKMNRFLPIIFLVPLVVLTLGGNGCATKKYVRNTVNERVTPLEGRTQELEETVRRNTQDINSLDDRLSKRIDDVSGRADRAQTTAESANTRATAVASGQWSVASDEQLHIRRQVEFGKSLTLELTTDFHYALLTTDH